MNDKETYEEMEDRLALEKELLEEEMGEEIW